MESLAKLVLELERLGDRIAFVDRERYRTRSHRYGSVIAAARQVAGALVERGVGSGDRLLLIDEPGAAWATLFYGALLAGAVVVPLDPATPDAFVREVRTRTGARLRLGRGGDLALGGELALDAQPIAQPVERPEDALLEIVYTSGTTGTPRGVRITHGNLLANLRPIAREIGRYRLALRAIPPLRFLHLIPLSHLFGQVMALFIPELTGGRVIFEGSSPSRVQRAARDLGANVVVCVPQQLQALGEHICARAGIDPAVVRADGERPTLGRWWRYRAAHALLGRRLWAFVVVGAALAEPVETLWRRLGFAVIVGYGLTETAPVVSVSHPLRRRPGTVGKALPGVEIRIAADGEVEVRGANVTSGYEAEPEATAAAIDGGWLKTGDLGRLDDDGNLHILGRKKDVIVTADGSNVHPEDVEIALTADPDVREAAVVARNVDGRELVHAVVVPAGLDLDVAAIVARANARLEPALRIQSWSARAAPLPRTRTGKLRRVAIRAELASAGEREEETASPVAAAIARLRGRVLVDGATRLSDDLGLTSLDRIELMVELESRAGASIDEGALAAATTVADLERLIAAPRAAPSGGRPLHPRWPLGALARGFRRIALPVAVGPLQRVFVRVRAHGTENVDALRPPFLIVANHQSALDPGPILRALPWRLRHRVLPITGIGAFRRWLTPAGQPLAGQLVDGLGLFLVRLFLGGLQLPTGAGLEEAIARAARVADSGCSLLLFPEGERSTDGAMAPFRPGVGVLARELGLPVVPVRIDGMVRIHPVGAFWPRRGTADVTFGAVYDPSGRDPETITRELEELYRGDFGVAEVERRE